MAENPESQPTVSVYEYLGDAILDYFVVIDLYTQYSNAQPASLTYMHHSRHGSYSLGAFCVTSGLVDKLTDVPLDSQRWIKKYKREILAAKSDRPEFWTEVVQHQVSTLAKYAFAPLSNYINLAVSGSGFDTTFASRRNPHRQLLLPRSYA